MPVRFIPASTRFQQIAIPEWTLSSWGLDQASVAWGGPRTDADRYLSTVKRFEVMPGFSRMYLDTADRRNNTPSFPHIEKKYLGFRDGTVPPVKIVDDTTSQTVTGNGIDTAPSSPTYQKSVSGQITYDAPQTTYTWFETSAPGISPKYSTLNNKSGIGITGFSVQPTQGDDGTIIYPTYSAFVAIINSLSLQLLVADYEREELVKGIIWGCRSIIQLRITNG